MLKRAIATIQKDDGGADKKLSFENHETESDHRKGPANEMASDIGRRKSLYRGPGESGADRRKSMMPGVGPRPSIAGTSIKGLLASRMFARRMTMKLKEGSEDQSSLTGLLPVEKEPTYRMEPTKKFNVADVRDIIKEVLEDKLEDYSYSPKFSANMTKVLSDEIKDRVKELDFDRYKIICNVVMGQEKGQSVMVTSRCTWDVKWDNHASYTLKSGDFFCTVSVYGIFTE